MRNWLWMVVIALLLSCTFSSALADCLEGGIDRAGMAYLISHGIPGFESYVPSATPIFPDVPSSYWAYKEIDFVIENGIASGYVDGNFHPTYQVTRDQMAVYFARAMEVPNGEAGLADYIPPVTPTFSDVPTGYWSYLHVEFLAATLGASLIGYPDGTFRPRNPMTNYDAAAWIQAGLGASGDPCSVPTYPPYVRVSAGTYPAGPVFPPDPPAGTTRHYLTGQLHAHWMSDDGIVNLTPLGLESLYALAGYDFIAPTEHHPDPKWAGLAPGMFEDPHVSGIIHLGDSMEDSCGPDPYGPSPTGYSHILGAAFDWHNLPVEQQVSIWSKVGSEDRGARLDNIRVAGGGLAFIPHPNSHQYFWSPQTLMSLCHHYDGIEVFNSALEMAIVGGIEPVLTRAQSRAVDTWTALLAQGYNMYATASDDFTSPCYAALNRGCVTAVVDLPNDTSPAASDIESALRSGRFYASYTPWWSPSFASAAPAILGWWWDEGAMRTRIRVYSPLNVKVRFFTNLNRDEGEEVSLAPVEGMPGTWDASYSASAANTWVRAEVRDALGAVSLTQPVWWSWWESASAHQISATGQTKLADATPLVLDLADAHLEVSYPQSGITEVMGELVDVLDRPFASPPLGYTGYCYSFAPDTTLSGANHLTIAYDPSDITVFREGALSIYRFDAAVGAWVKLPSAVDLLNHKVTAQISNLGLFALSGEIGWDTTAPQVSILAPGPGESISGDVVIQAVATDDNGVALVRFFLDGLYIGSDTSGADGWSRRLDCSQYADGPHTIHVLAQDGSGNDAEAEVLVVIGGGLLPPTISIARPTPGTVIWDKVEANGTWSASPPLTAGLLHIGDMPVSLIAIGDGAWTAGASGLGLNGPYVLQVEGSDLSGNRAVAEVEIVVRSFHDIPLDFWARDHIYAIARANIAQGYPEGDYKPDLAVTRDQMAVYISRAVAGGDANVPDPGCTGPIFTDVDCDQWARKYIQYAVSQGVVEGYDATTYAPDEIVDRAQMAVYIARAVAGGDSSVPDGPPTATFGDVPTDYWAYKYVEYCKTNEIVQGYDPVTYAPEVDVTRDQMAVYVARAFGLTM